MVKPADHGMTDIGIAAMDHHLQSVAAAALIGMADQAHVAGVDSLRQIGHRRSS